MTGHECEWSRLYRDLQCTLADVTAKQSSLHNAWAELRASLLRLLRKHFPEEVRTYGWDHPKTNPSDRLLVEQLDHLLGVRHGSLPEPSQPDPGLEELRTALLQAGFELPSGPPDPRLWAELIRQRDRQSVVNQLLEEETLGDLFLPAELVPEVPADLESGEIPDLPEEPELDVSPPEVGRRFDPTAQIPGQQPDQKPETLASDEALIPVIGLPRPVFGSDLEPLLGPRDQVGLWERGVKYDHRLDLRFVHGPRALEQRFGALYLPGKRIRDAVPGYEKSLWFRLSKQDQLFSRRPYTGTGLYMLGLVVRALGDQLLSVQDETDLVLLRRKSRRSGSYDALLFFPNRVGNTRKLDARLGRLLRELVNEPVTYLLVLTAWSSDVGEVRRFLVTVTKEWVDRTAKPVLLADAEQWLHHGDVAARQVH